MITALVVISASSRAELSLGTTRKPRSHIGSGVGVYNVRTLVCWAADVNRERCESPRAKGRASAR